MARPGRGETMGEPHAANASTWKYWQDRIEAGCRSVAVRVTPLLRASNSPCRASAWVSRTSANAGTWMARQGRSEAGRA